MSRPTIAKIDLDALRHNYGLAESLAPGSQTIPMVKANTQRSKAGRIPSANSHLPSLPTKRVVGASQPLDSSSTAVWMTPRSDVDQHAMAALITRALSVKLSSVLRTAECHFRRTLVSCGNVHRSMCHCSRPTSALLDRLSCSPQAQMTLPISAPAQSSSRASVGKLPCIVFVINGDARSDLARTIAPREKVARSGPSFSRKREIDRRR